MFLAFFAFLVDYACLFSYTYFQWAAAVKTVVYSTRKLELKLPKLKSPAAAADSEKQQKSRTVAQIQERYSNSTAPLKNKPQLPGPDAISIRTTADSQSYIAVVNFDDPEIAAATRLAEGFSGNGKWPASFCIDEPGGVLAQFQEELDGIKLNRKTTPLVLRDYFRPLSNTAQLISFIFFHVDD